MPRDYQRPVLVDDRFAPTSANIHLAHMQKVPNGDRRLVELRDVVSLCEVVTVFPVVR